MNDYRFDEDALQARSQGIGHRTRVALGVLCCERLFPNYVVFQRESGWGRPGTLREALDAVWQWLEDRSAETTALRSLQSEVEAAEPSTEDFDSLYVSAALDAATSVGALLQMVLENQEEGLAEIASYARDTVDMYVQEIERMDPADPSLEEQIRQHPLMQRELERQDKDFELLGGAEMTSDLVRVLRRDRKNLAEGNLGVPA